MDSDEAKRQQHNAQILINLSSTSQPCDITFFKRSPMLDVKVHERLFLALSYGAGAAKLLEMLQSIDLSNGESVSIGEIWTVNPMPVGGISQEDMEAVDLNDGEQVFEGNGKTIREMITEVYHCKTQNDTDYYLRRFLAS